MLGRPLAGPVLSSKLADYRLQLYASRDYIAAHGLPADVVALAGHRLIGYVPDLLYAPELAYLDEIGPRLEPTVRSPSINAQHALIAAAAGIGVLPCFIGVQDPLLVPVLPERSILRSFWLVTHKDTRQRQRVRVFRAWLTDLVRRQRPVLMGE
jgi:DNA-binding transcriptional LysR family regulator